MKTVVNFLSIVVIALVMAIPAFADNVFLANGNVLQGKILFYNGVETGILVAIDGVSTNGVITVSNEEIRNLEYNDEFLELDFVLPDPDLYEKMKAHQEALKQASVRQRTWEHKERLETMKFEAAMERGITIEKAAKGNPTINISMDDPDTAREFLK